MGFGSAETGAGKVTVDFVRKNYTTTPLGSDASYTSAAFETDGYSKIIGVCFADKASATDGLEIQQSEDGTNFDLVSKFTVAANVGLGFSVEVVGTHDRVKMTNSSVAQTVLRFYTFMRSI